MLAKVDGIPPLILSNLSIDTFQADSARLRPVRS